MSEPVVVVAGGGDTASSDFAAGLATAAAAQASQDAQEAQAVAVGAAELAAAADREASAVADTAVSASLDAASAHERIGELETYVQQGFGHISDALVADAVEHTLAEAHDGGGAPEPTGGEGSPTPEGEKPPEKRVRHERGRGGAFAHSWWFRK